MIEVTVSELEDLEAKIEHSFWEMVGALYEIEQRELYRPAYSQFSEYMFGKWAHLGVSQTTWRQWRASYIAYLEAHDVGAILHNEYAARKLRAVEQNARRLVATLARDYSKDGTIRASDILRASEVVADVLETAAVSGFIDPGDGDMVGIGAAVETTLQERILRQRQHIADSAKKAGWSDPVYIYLPKDGYAYPREWFVDIPPGAKIEAKWRIVKDGE